MFVNFSDIANSVKIGLKPNLVVALAAEEELLKALSTAKSKYLSKVILIGSQEEIRKISADKKINLQDMQIIDIVDLVAACNKAVSLVHQGEADFIMKGLVDTSIFLKVVIDKNNGLMMGRLLSSIMIMKIKTYHKFLMISDGGIIIDPDLEKKKGIIENAVDLANLLGIQPVKVGCLAAKEKVNLKMPATVDAVALKKLSEKHYFGENVIVDGPLAMDLMVSSKAAQIKGYVSEVAGDVDVILVPNIETGNAVSKVMTHLGNAESAGIVMGACVPIILTSRSDSYENKLNSIILGTYLAQHMGDCHETREEQKKRNEKVINRK